VQQRCESGDRGLVVFNDEGWLSSLEIWWIDQPPPEFPPPEDFQPPTLSC
jgi:hypothetical protein